MHTWRDTLLGALAAALVCAASALPARADEKLDALLEKAAFAAVDREYLAAAKHLGEAAARAHSQGLLLDERWVLRDVERLVRRARLRGRLPDPARPVTAADLLATVISRLDASEAHAHVSADALSIQLLIDGTTTGTPELTGVAEEALRRHARAPGSGDAATMWADYARGLLAVELYIADRGSAHAAIQPLDAALDACEAEGWQEPAVYVGTELASVYMTLEQPSRAALTYERIGALLPGGTDPALVTLWEGLTTTRLPDAPPEVLAPLVHTRSVVVSEPRNATGRGSNRTRSSGGRSKIGHSWSDLARDRPFVIVERRRSDFKLRHEFGSKFGMIQPPRHGLRFLVGGGIRLCAHAQAVSLERVDLTDRGDGFSNGGRRPRWKAWKWLARGESWGLSRSGRVIVTKRSTAATGSDTVR